MSTAAPKQSLDRDDLDECSVFTYFAQRGVDGPVKIGRAGDVRRRMSQLQGGCSERLIVRGVISADVEKTLHERFRSKRMSGEWFRVDAELEDYMSSLFGPHDPLDVMVLLCRQMVIEHERLQPEIMDMWIDFVGVRTTQAECRWPYLKAFADHIDRLRTVIAEMNRRGTKTEIKWPLGTLVSKAEAEAASFTPVAEVAR
jgi:hypothetical protein